MDTPQIRPVPKRSCIITLMFEIATDDEAMKVKKVIDDVVKDLENKKYNFQINES